MAREATEVVAVPEEGSVVATLEARYELVHAPGRETPVLGRGGMGEVRLARLVAGGFRDLVALKSVAPELVGDERMRRELAAEAELMRELIHQNIAKAYGLEVTGDGCYLVLEYVDGLSVREVLARAGGLSEGFSCYVVASVAEALEYAHGRRDERGKPLGIVHRDVKASNVMVSWGGGVKLLDFGVAFSRHEGRERTQTGKLKGTWSYLSPEQARGRGEPVDWRADLFSLGIVLVELLTGTRPFEGESDLETAQKIRDCSAREVEAATRQVATGLREICRKALSKEAGDRFQTGGELALALRGYLVGRGIVYGASECARELQERCQGSASPASGVDGEGSVAGGWAMKSEWAAAGTGGAKEPRRVKARLLLAGLVLVGGGLGLAGATALRGRLSRAAGAGAVAVNQGLAVEVAGRCEAAPGAGPGGDGSTKGGLEDLVVVRPKRVKRGSTAGTGAVVEQAAGRRNAKEDGRAAAEGGAGAGTGESMVDERGAGVLAPGTLIGAELVDAIDASAPRAVEARVREDVQGGGVVQVPKGSGIMCSSARAKGGRVELACGEIRVGKAKLALSGVGVQRGQVGLRAVDGTVPAGTTFSVYVGAAGSW